MLVTLPFTLLLLDVWPLGRKPSWREKIPLFLLAAASSVVTFLVQRSYGAMTLGERHSFGFRVGNAVVACATYLAKCVVPVRLAVYYPYPAAAYPLWEVALFAILLAGITWLALRESRARPWLAVGWLWFLGTLVPVIGLLQVGTQAMADRYMYVPMIGLSAAVAFAAAEAKPLLPALLLVCTPTWTALTWRQVRVWEDDSTLFGPLAAAMPENAMAHHVLGTVHLRERRFDQAVAEFQEALRLRPDYAEARGNLGIALELSGHPAEAIVEYEGAVRAAPDRADLRYNLGRLLAIQGRSDPALEQYEAAVRSDPDLAEAQGALGELYLRVGRTDQAIPHLERALELRPGWTEVQRMLAAARAAGRPR
jgi:tetratricopeptide (TPR) repeat protein